ncbi:MAG: SdrD B-like domain-containing protein [Acidobacteriota bacterium]|nr:SdrD B-like domain-containing protein [Acidobacteriota bacterium]
MIQRPILIPVHRLALFASVMALLLAVMPAGAQPASQVGSIEELAREELEAAMLSGAPPVEIFQAGVAALGAAVPEGSPTMRCLPSCLVDDGRFLAVASGANLVTLSETSLDVQVAVPAGVSSFQIGIFDGDADAANGNWDVGAAPFTYEIFEDPNRDGSSSVSVAGPFASGAMLNNAWFDITVNVGPGALAPSGVGFYRLSIASQNPSLTVLNSFKLRTDGVASVEVRQQPFGFYAAIQSLADASAVFPDFPTYDSAALPGSPGASNYDGEFNFYLDINSSEDDLVVWGGDLDYGAWDGSTRDTDDPDTPNAPFLPPWATLDAVSEGLSAGLGGASGNPPDDVDPSGLGAYLQRSPSITFELIDPEGTVYLNDNPSGNQEWEQFRIATGPFDPATADFPAASLPVGTWVVRARGVDMQNLNFWRFFHPVLCSEPDGSPCVALRSYLLGDTVFADDDGNGVQDAGEAGIEGVTLLLLDSDGDLVASTVTDADGYYEFPVDGGFYSVTVAATNFLAGGALEGLELTTAFDPFDVEVVDDNILTLDFGYRATGSIGNFVWYDANGDGVFNEDPGSGLGDVALTLIEAGGDGLLGTADDVTVGTTATDAGGAYDFLNLPPGLYLVDVDETTIPAGLVLSTGNEPFEVVLGAGEDFDDADFGYAPDVDQCSACDGKVTELTLRYFGAADGVQVEVRTRHHGTLLYSGVLDSGDVFSFVGQDRKGTVGPAIEIFVDGQYVAMLHTSCSEPIGPGTVAGDFVVLAGSSRNGGALCPVDGGGGGGDPGPGDCGACEGKVTALTLEYLGADTAYVVVYANKGGGVRFSGFVAPGELFSFTGGDRKGTLGPSIKLFVDGHYHTTMHTSCSVPIGPGTVARDFLVIEGASRNGGALCPVDDGAGTPVAKG